MRRISKKPIIFGLSVAVIAALGVGGTVAWLADKSDEVKNTFTPSTIGVELTESKDLDLQMVPGKQLTKDPRVTVDAKSEASYVFVEIVKSADYSTYMEDYVVDSAWTWLETNGLTSVYWRAATEAELADGETYVVLKDDKVQVKTSVTEEMLDAFDADNDGVLSDQEAANLPTLSFTAYVIQQETFADAKAAWAQVKAEGTL